MKNWIPVALSLAILIVCTLSWWAVQGASIHIRGAAAEMLHEARLLREKVAKMLTSSWVSSGITRTVTSTQRDNETWTQFLDRHDDEVDEAKVKWPVS